MAIKSVYHKLGRLEEGILLVCIPFLISLIFIEVIFRYLIKITLGWYSEMTTILYMWSIFIGVSYTYRVNRHLSLVLLVERIKNFKIKNFIQLISEIFVFVSSLYIIYFGSIIVSEQFSRGFKTMYFGIPMYVVSLVIPISGVLILMTSGYKMVYLLKEKSDGEK
ncbi:MAG: TRAP transporter small permease subunit [Archaeoglobus sp.]|nr:TRAP transporter small permease subunit [Archaeoglobus sp.]